MTSMGHRKMGTGTIKIIRDLLFEQPTHAMSLESVVLSGLPQGMIFVHVMFVYMC